jgi:hypothetical protein
MRYKNHDALAAYVGVYQVRGDIAFKLALLLITIHAISARIVSEFKAVSAVTAPAAPKPSLKVFIASDGTLRLDPTASIEVSPADFKTAVSNLVAKANGQPTVIALCLSENRMSKALLGAGIAVAQVATNAETILTINLEPRHESID